MKELLDQTYSTNYTEKRRMDIFLPESNPSRICMLFIHGGGWTGGNRKNWHPVARYFCKQGFTCVSIGYRLTPESIFPEQIKDVRSAMSYLKDNASDLLFDSQKIVAVGSSAGGHLVLMLSTIDSDDDLGYTKEMKVLDTRPCLAICYCPVTTVHLYNELWEGRPSMPEFVPKFMGITEEADPELFKQASPIDRIKGGEPPSLFIHGDIDVVVPLKQSILACENIRHHGGYAEVFVLHNVEHGFGYGIETPEQKRSIEKIELFLEEQGVLTLNPSNEALN